MRHQSKALKNRLAIIDSMYLPTPTPAAIRRLRSLTEADLPVKLSDEEWALAATKLLQIYYLQFYAMGDELARQGLAVQAVTRKKPISRATSTRICNGGENEL